MGQEIVTGSEFTTADDYDPKVLAKAYELFLNTDMNTADIALSLSIPTKTVALWARRGDWRTRKRQLDAELMAIAEDQYRSLIIKNRGPVIERHLRVSQKLEEMIEDLLNRLKAGEAVPDKAATRLKQLSEALSGVTAVSARAAAISDKPFSNDSGDGKPQKQALIVIGVQAQASPGKEPPVINVEAKEI